MTLLSFQIAASVLMTSFGAPPILVTNLDGSGLTIEWSVDKTRTPEPDTARVRIVNLLQLSRKALAEVASLGLGLNVSLMIGWQKVPTMVFNGLAHKITPETFEGTDIVTTVECGAGGDISSSSPSSAAIAGAGVPLVLAKLLGDLKIPPSPTAFPEVTAAAAKVPAANLFQWVTTGNPREDLDLLMASIGLSWGIERGFFVVYAGGLRNDLLPLLLSPSTGLVKWAPLDDGGYEFEALADASAAPGQQVIMTDEKSLPIGGPLRIDKLVYTGSTRGPSIMQGTARKVVIL